MKILLCFSSGIRASIINQPCLNLSDICKVKFKCEVTGVLSRQSSIQEVYLAKYS
jgi:hypothetical protein